MQPSRYGQAGTTEYSHNYYAAHKEKEAIRYKKYLQGLRRKVVDYLGGKCARCGIDDARVLQIDHIKGNGRKDRLKYKGNATHMLRVLKSKEGFQLLCANCNFLKRLELKEN